METRSKKRPSATPPNHESAGVNSASLPAIASLERSCLMPALWRCKYSAIILITGEVAISNTANLQIDLNATNVFMARVCMRLLNTFQFSSDLGAGASASIMAGVSSSSTGASKLKSMSDPISEPSQILNNHDY